MEISNKDISIIIKADELFIPEGLTEDDLFLFLKPQIVDLFEKGNNKKVYIGLAPDNTADNNDELLYDGQLLRVICNEKYLGVDLNCSVEDIKKAFEKLISSYNPYWTTIIEERGFIRKETTIDLLYRNVFTLE